MNTNVIHICTMRFRIYAIMKAISFYANIGASILNGQNPDSSWEFVLSACLEQLA